MAVLHHSSGALTSATPWPLFLPEILRIFESDRSLMSHHLQHMRRVGFEAAWLAACAVHAVPLPGPMTKDASMANAVHRPHLAPSRVTKPDQAFIDQLRGFSLTTAEILYRLPDHPALLQSFVWQDYDVSPKFPKLKKFLNYWTHNLDGALFGVRVVHASLIKPAELKLIDGEFKLS
jgi:uncharacterized protein Usg